MGNNYFIYDLKVLSIIHPLGTSLFLFNYRIRSSFNYKLLLFINFFSGNSISSLTLIYYIYLPTTLNVKEIYIPPVTFMFHSEEKFKTEY